MKEKVNLKSTVKIQRFEISNTVEKLFVWLMKKKNTNYL